MFLKSKGSKTLGFILRGFDTYAEKPEMEINRLWGGDCFCRPPLFAHIDS